MSETDIIDTVEMEDVEREERSCDLCKLSYSNEEGLQEHNWSLMHHIKIEQKKKGASHNCSLCFAICPNIIEYGKHLNGDKHKRALEESRRQREGEEEISSEKQALLDKLSDMEKAHFDKNQSDDDEAIEGDRNVQNTNYKKYNKKFPRKRGNFSKSFRGHQRSFSQPNTYRYIRNDTKQQRYPSDYQSVTFNSGELIELKKRVPWYDDSVNFDNPHWHNGGFQYDNQPWQMSYQQEWIDPQEAAWQQGGYNDYNSIQQPVWGGPACENFRAPYPNFEKSNLNSAKNFDITDQKDYSDDHKSSYRDRNRNYDSRSRRRENDSYRIDNRHSASRERNRNYDDTELSSPTVSHRSPHLDDSGNLKRRRSNQDMTRHISRRECDSPSDDFLKESSRDRENHTRNRHQEVTSSDKIALPSKRYRHQPVEEKRLDEADSTTDIDGLDKIPSKPHVSGNKTSSDSNSIVGKKKSKHKKKKSGTKSPTESPKRPSSKKIKEKASENVSILEKAERLCKDLRDKREKAKMEREKKEKQKKIEKTEELNTQIKNLSDINKSYVKGVLSVEEEKLSTVVSNQIKLNDIRPCSGSTSKKVSFEPISTTKSDEQNFTVDRIRQEIEESVRTSPKRKNNVSQDISFSNSISEETSKEMNQVADSSPKSQGSSLFPKQNSEPVAKDALLKMINSPRSRKERLYIAEKLRSYAQSQNKLSLPRFNLQLSGLYDDIDDTAQDLNLEELSPDVQLQIAQLIEDDIKPDIDELERALFVNKRTIKVENDQNDEYSVVAPKTELILPEDRYFSLEKGASEFDMHSMSVLKDIPSVKGQSSKVRSKAIPKDSNDTDMDSLSVSKDIPSVKNASSKVRSKEFPTDTNDLDLNSLSVSKNRLSNKDQSSEIGSKKFQKDSNDIYLNSLSMSHNNLSSKGHSSDRSQEFQQGTGDIDTDSFSAAMNSASVKGQSSKVRSEETPAGLNSRVDWNKNEQISNNTETFSRLTQVEEMNKRNNYETMETDVEPVLTLHDLSHDKTDIKQEPEDSGYEIASGYTGKTSSNISRSNDSEIESFNKMETDPHILNLTSITTDKVQGSYQQDSALVPEIISARSDMSGIDVLSGSNSEVDKIDSSRMSDISMHSSMSSLQSESLFETVYDISLKEEHLRQEVIVVDKRIADLNKVIEEAKQQLYKCQEKKQSLLTEEEMLRTQRLKILKDAKNIQRSARNLSQGNNIYSGLNHSASTSNLSDGTLTNVSSLASSTPVLSRFLEPTQNHNSHSFTKTRPPSGNLQHRRHSLSESGSKESKAGSNSARTTNDTSMSLSRLDNQVNSFIPYMVIEKPEKLCNSESSAVKSDKNKTRNKSTVSSEVTYPVDIKSSKNKPRHISKDSNEVTSPVGLKSKQSDISVYSQLPPPMEPVKVDISCSDDLSSAAAFHDKELEMYVPSGGVQQEKLPTSPVHLSTSQNIGSPKSNRLSQETGDVDRSTELKKVGFVTLNSLLKSSDMEEGRNLTKMLSNEANSLDEFLSGLSDCDNTKKESKKSEEKKVRRSKRLNPEPVKEKVDETKKFSNVNVKYMGTLPNDIDRDSFLKEIGGGKQPDKLSYMVVGSDQSQDVLSKLQSIIGSNSGIKDGNDESVTTQSSVGDAKLMELDYKSESSSGKAELPPLHQETDSNYESIASNCSLGEKIKQYCRSNKSRLSRKRKEVSVTHSDTDTDPDKTLQDGEVDSESATPVRVLTECSAVLQKLELNSEPRIPMVGDSPTSDKILPEENLSRSLSPFRKRLKTKKERDRKSARKQKEEYVVDSSSEANSVDDDDSILRLSDLKQKLKFRGTDSPVKDMDLADLCKTGSEDMVDSSVKTPLSAVDHCRDLDKRKNLLDEVQLDSVTESEDNRPCRDDADSNTTERFKLKPDVLATFRAAMKNTIKQGREMMQKEELSGVTFDGPESPVQDIQTLDDHLYVCYRCMVIRKFHLKTGQLLHEYKTAPASMNCLQIVAVNTSVRLYAGGHSCILMLFDSKSGKRLNSEEYEERIQCMHSSNGKLYIGTIEGAVIVKNVKTGKIMDTFRCTEKPISCISSATEGTRKVLLVASHDAVIYVCDSSSGLLLRMLEGHNRLPFCIHVDGHTVYSGSNDKVVLEHHLLTGDLMWTYNQPEGIVSGVSEYKDYLICGSYDKFIYCYDKKNRKLLKKFYGAGKSIINKMAVTDGLIITGNREGQVEAIPLPTGDGFNCECEGCGEVYGLKDHLLHHMLAVHVQQNVRVNRCQWKGCSDWISTENGYQEAEEHFKSHLS